MKKRSYFLPIFLVLALSVIIAVLVFFNLRTLSGIRETNREIQTAIDQISQKQQELSQMDTFFSTASKTTTASTNTAGQATAIISHSSGNSVFQQSDVDSFSDTTNSGAETAEPNGYIVCIDPGHQSFDIDMSSQEPIGPGASETKAMSTSGTTGAYSGLPEFQLNLDVALKLQIILEQRGYTVVMTRTGNDIAISNKERAEFAAAQNADIFVRIHANGEDSGSSSGALTMAPSPENPYVSYLSSDSVLLSQCILDSYCEATGFSNLGVQYYDNMSGINWSTVPVTIIEMGFMTNEHDDTQMSNSDFQYTMAQGIADGIDTYFE